MTLVAMIIVSRHEDRSGHKAGSEGSIFLINLKLNKQIMIIECSY